mmetsp:Transcript_147390/g.282477  ORF Transcript_147390/g.282477 Transcript_147390/m.282477 type:complete len:95 (+) Transcript_147390:1354-1638(+)
MLSVASLLLLLSPWDLQPCWCVRVSLSGTELLVESFMPRQCFGELWQGRQWWCTERAAGEDNLGWRLCLCHCSLTVHMITAGSMACYLCVCARN